MTIPAFSVHPTSHYKRLSTKLQKGHRDFESTEKSAVAILSADPYNRARRYKTKKNWKSCQRARVSTGLLSAAQVQAVVGEIQIFVLPAHPARHRSWRSGWDCELGGIQYFIDIERKPTMQLVLAYTSRNDERLFSRTEGVVIQRAED